MKKRTDDQLLSLYARVQSAKTRMQSETCERKRINLTRDYLAAIGNWVAYMPAAFDSVK